MRKRNVKTVDGLKYEKVDTSRYFRIKARSIKKAFSKLEFIHSREIKEMFSHLTVDSVLADKRESRLVLSVRQTEDEQVSYPVKTIVATEFKNTENFGFKYPKFTPCKFIEQLQLVTEILPTVKWID